MSDLDNDLTPHPAAARREPVRHPARFRRRARQGHLDPPPAPAGHRPRRRRRDRGDRADGDVRHQGHELRRAAAACHPAVHGHRHELAPSPTLDAHDGRRPARPRRHATCRPAPRRPPGPGRRRHRAGPDQRGRRALDERRRRRRGRRPDVRSVPELARLRPQPGRDGGRLGDRRGRRDGLGRRRDEPFVLARAPASTTSGSARSRAPTAARQAADCTYFVTATTWNRHQPEAFALSGDGVLGDVDPDRTHRSASATPPTTAGCSGSPRSTTSSPSCSAVLDPAVLRARTPLVADLQPRPRHVLAERRLRARQRPLRRRHRRRRQIAVYDARTGELLADRSNDEQVAWPSTTTRSGRTRPTCCSASSRTASGRWSGWTSTARWSTRSRRRRATRTTCPGASRRADRRVRTPIRLRPPDRCTKWQRSLADESRRLRRRRW